VVQALMKMKDILERYAMLMPLPMIKKVKRGNFLNAFAKPIF